MRGYSGFALKPPTDLNGPSNSPNFVVYAFYFAGEFVKHARETGI
jgi:hypothetical protein